MRYEVRSEPRSTEEAVDEPTGQVRQYFVETRRTSIKDAETDVELVKMAGKRAWIAEIES